MAERSRSSDPSSGISAAECGFLNPSHDTCALEQTIAALKKVIVLSALPAKLLVVETHRPLHVALGFSVECRFESRS